MFGVSNVTNRMDPNSLRSRLFVGNLNTIYMQKHELEAIFQKYGQVIGISVHKGYAFVQYSNELSARAALNNEDGKVYFNMELDVSFVNESKNRKRGRSYAGALLCDQPNLAELSFQNQAALAAIGGQFSQLGFLPQLQSSQQNRHLGFNIPGIIGSPLLATCTCHETAPSNHVVSTSQHKCRTTLASQSVDTGKKAKRTRLENPALMLSLNKLSSADVPHHEFSSKSPISVDSSSPNPKSKRLIIPRSNDSSISEKFSDMTVNNERRLRSLAYRENEKSSTPLKSCGNLETQLSFPTTTTTPEQTTQSKPSSSSNPDIEDILICGRCRKLFDTVDELLSHKTMNYCVIGVNDRDSEHSCRCKALGEPESLGCYFCNKKFLSSWELLEHYRLEHNLTAYRVPKPPKPSSSSTSKQEMSVSEPIFTSNNSRVKEKPLDSQKSLEKESKCQDELDDSVEIVESPESSNNTICILSDDENDDTE